MTEQQPTPESEQDTSRLWKVLCVSAAIIVVPVIIIYFAVTMNQIGVLIGGVIVTSLAVLLFVIHCWSGSKKQQNNPTSSFELLSFVLEFTLEFWSRIFH